MLKTLRVGAGAARFNWLPVFLAERLALLGDLSIEVVRTGAVDRATAGVLDGSIDLAITPPEGAIRSAVQGGPLRIIAGNTNALPLTLVARPGISSIEDLRGGRLGTSSLVEGTALYTMEILREHGLHYPADYEFEIVGVHPARWQALQDGRIDAALQPAPLNFVAIDQGYSDLGEASDVLPQIVFTAILAHRDRLESIRSELLAFLRGVRKGTLAFTSGEYDALSAEILEELGEADGATAARAIEYLRAKRAFPADLRIPEAAFATSVRLMTAAGLLDPAAVPQAATALDERWLDTLDEVAP